MTDIPVNRRVVDLGVDHYRQRVAHIQAYAAEQQLDGLLLLDANNVMWASGFFHIPNERPLGLYIPASGKPIFLVPFLEKDQAAASWIGDVRWYWEYPGIEAPEAWMLREIGVERIGLDSGSYTLIQQLQAFRSQLTVDSGVAVSAISKPKPR